MEERGNRLFAELPVVIDDFLSVTKDSHFSGELVCEQGVFIGDHRLFEKDGKFNCLHQRLPGQSAQGTKIFCNISLVNIN